MVPGFAYTIEMKSKVVDAFLRLEDPSGKQVAENDDAAAIRNRPKIHIVYRPGPPGSLQDLRHHFRWQPDRSLHVGVRQADNSSPRTCPAAK